MQVCSTRKICEARSMTATYGLPGERASFCVSHRTQGVVGACTCVCTQRPCLLILPTMELRTPTCNLHALLRCAWPGS